MGRSNYSDDCEHLALWRGAVNSAIRGKRGQKLLHDLAVALDAMPEKKLIAYELQNEAGEVCALGAVGVARGLNMKAIDPLEPLDVSAEFDIAYALAAEVAYINDEAAWRPETPAQRWLRVRRWVAEQLRPAAPSPETTGSQKI